MHFDERICQDLNVALRREWLEANGLGGYASSTIVGLNTRRYHGLLVAATKPPVGRMVLLAKLEETLVLDGRRYDLPANRYPGVIHPEGYRYLKEFRQDPFPVFVYEVDGLQVEKSIFLVHGENTAVIEYTVRGALPPVCSLELRPLLAFRDYHSLTHENGALDARLEVGADWVKMAPYADLPPLYLAHAGAELRATGDWYRNFEYDRERERGLDYREDLFNPLALTFDMRRDQRCAVVASMGEPCVRTAEALRAAELERRQPLADTLTRAADQFLVARGNQTTVIAGYHWFADWGRDTLIALPGLTLATGRYDAAKSILLAFAAHADRGMLPNHFPDTGEPPAYNTVDAALWFFEAARVLGAATEDYDFVRDKLYGVMSDMIDWHLRGTRYGIRADKDGLLYAGEPGMQLTWMDVKIGDWVVTPRQGKPVEIQALWYNALRTMQALAGRFQYAADSDRYREIAERAQMSFHAQFWNAADDCLYDVVDGDTRDASIRPNQIFAASLFHRMLSQERARAVVAAVERHLLTPYGLRTLAPGDPRYRGRYEGDPVSRDSAYHQGTVWPWLMGPFLTAYLEVNGGSAAARTQAGQWLDVFHRYRENEGAGQMPEVFDGDEPQRPGGCIAQAWSVAELLRVATQLSPGQRI